MNGHGIAILLSTYNGEKFLRAQLDSLWAQTTQDFVVLARDDGSADGTAQILAEEARNRPGRLVVVDSEGGRMGPMRSFATLLGQCDAEYIAFCDQDDVWERDKLERFRDAIREQEAVSGATTAILCCSDVVVTDVNLQVTAPSYFGKHRIQTGPDGAPLARLIFRNFAIGASTMINRALRDLALPIPEQAVMHDWWLALIAQSLGRVVVLPGSSMRYRQHGRNAIGSKARRLPRSISQVRADWNWSTTSAARCIRQAAVLYETYGKLMNDGDRTLLARFQSFPSSGPMGRLMVMLKSRAFKPSFALNTVHLLACATAKI